MKHFLKKILLTAVLLTILSVSYAQNIVQNIGDFISAGNVGGMARHFDNAVSLTIGGKQATYSRSQAEMVLRDFFNKNKAPDFSVERKGDNKSGCFAIGALATDNGNFRVYFSVRKKNESYVIQEIRFEK